MKMQAGFLDADGWISRYARFSIELPAGLNRLQGRVYCPDFSELEGNELLCVLDRERLEILPLEQGQGWIAFDIPLPEQAHARTAEIILRSSRFHIPPPPDERLLGLIIADLALNGTLLSLGSPDESQTASLPGADALLTLGLLQPEALAPYLPDGSSPYPEEAVDLLGSVPDDRVADVFSFFDPEHYRTQFAAGDASPGALLRHFLVHGLEHHLSPHPLIDLRWIAGRHPGLLKGGHQAIMAFASMLAEGQHDPSPFLDLEHIRRNMPLKPEQPLALSFIRQGPDGLFAPNPWFDPGFYAQQAPEGTVGSLALIRHFLAEGDARMLRPSEAFDPERYAKRYNLQISEGLGPLVHYLSIGRFCGYSGSEDPSPAGGAQQFPPTADYLPLESASQAMDEYEGFHRQAEARQHTGASFEESDIRPVRLKAGGHAEALRELAFAGSRPQVDAIIPAYNNFELTVESLVALSRCGGPRVRVILVDDASTDPRMAQLRGVPGLKLLRNATNLHFLRSCNAAMALATAPFVLLLNNDAQLTPDSLSILLDALKQNPGAAAAGPMLLYPNGRLQEAGCTVRHDGSTTMVGVGDDPARACYQYARDVPYISGACLLLRRSALEKPLFDERFAPAYSEDADLCLRLRAAGHRIIYEPAARVVHHLSASTNAQTQRRRVQGVRASQQKLLEKWGEQLLEQSRVRALAFYLPQFHPTTQNDRWWGRGFTEWTNVTRATPSFAGHYQPHLPADLGFYDLRLPEVMEQQQRLARRYGIEGFIIYHYRLGDGPILERPMEQLLARPDLDVCFAPCWANENWTRHWDGGERAMLLEQRYDSETLDALAADMLRMARDPRAIRVNGRPLLLVYRAKLIPDCAGTTQRIRRIFTLENLPNPYLVMVESMEGEHSPTNPSILGFDASVEFPPHGIAAPWTKGLEPIKAGWHGRVYDYTQTALNALGRHPAGYTRHPCVMPSWDNTARQPLAAHTLHGGSPALFQAFTERKIEEALNFTVGEERLLFINAWNEWAEGAHLEPDRAYGHRWLAALRQAMRNKGALV